MAKFLDISNMGGKTTTTTKTNTSSNKSSSSNIFTAIGNALKNLVTPSSSSSSSKSSSSSSSKTASNPVVSTGSVYSAPNNPAPKTNNTPSYNQPFLTNNTNPVTPTVSKPTTTVPTPTVPNTNIGTVIPSSLPSLTPIGETALGGSGNKVTQPVDLSTMDRNEKISAMEDAGIPLVYNDDAAQKIIDTMYNTGLDYDKTKAFMNTYGDVSGRYEQENEDQTSTSGNSAGAYNSKESLYNDIMAMFMEQNEAARQQMIDAIMSNLNAVKGEYKAQIQNVIDQYQQLINENEVARDRTRRRIRESQANRGQLDSGLGRQERLDLDTTYDTNNANIKNAREKAVQEIMTLITQAEAEANANKAQVNSNYDNALLEWKLANQ